ncbi:MAG: acetyl esterase [Actinomycetota bacterium]
MYLHGGGWLFGGFAGWEHLCMRLAAGADIIVVALEYRLAPEHHHPTGLHDAMDTLGWVEENAVELGVARDRLGVAGDSAGGNLAAGVALLACRQGAPNLAAQLLVYPALDVTRSSPSARDYRGPGLSVADMEQYSQLYLGDGDPRDELVSPLLADDVAGLPPTLIITAEHDPLRDEGRLYADRLDAAGVRVRHTDYLGYVHGFFSVPRLHPGVEQAWSEVTTWLARTLARPRDPQNKVSSAR